MWLHFQIGLQALLVQPLPVPPTIVHDSGREEGNTKKRSEGAYVYGGYESKTHLIQCWDCSVVILKLLLSTSLFCSHSFTSTRGKGRFGYAFFSSMSSLSIAKNKEQTSIQGELTVILLWQSCSLWTFVGNASYFDRKWAEGSFGLVGLLVCYG